MFFLELVTLSIFLVFIGHLGVLFCEMLYILVFFFFFFFWFASVFTSWIYMHSGYKSLVMSIKYLPLVLLYDIF